MYAPVHVNDFFNYSAGSISTKQYTVEGTEQFFVSYYNNAETVNAM